MVLLAAAVTGGQAVLLTVWMRKATAWRLGFWAALAAAGLGAFVSLVISAELIVHASALVLETVGRLLGFPLSLTTVVGHHRAGQPLDPAASRIQRRETVPASSGAWHHRCTPHDAAHRRSALGVNKRSLAPLFTSSARDGLEHGVGDVEVGVDVLDVVLILERVDQAQQLAGRILVERHGVRGHQRQLGG